MHNDQIPADRLTICDGMDWQFWNYFLWSLVNQPVKWEPGFSSQGKAVTRIERGRFSLPKAGDIHHVPPDMRHLISLPKILWLRTPPKHSLSPPQTPPRPTSASPASPDADGLCTLKLAQPPKHSSEGGGASAPWQGWTGAQMHSSS